MAQRLGLIIGNSVYNESSLTRLLTPDVDVGSLAEVLLHPEIGGFDDVNVLVNTSSATVRRAISSFFSGKNRDDLLILYFSGHGVLDQQGRLFLAVKDTDRKLLRGTAIPANFVTDEMNNSRSKRQVLILDCCHSGAFARGTKGAPGVSVGTAAAFEGTGFGRVVLTASDATQYAWEGDQVFGKGENSLFTHYLTEGLKSGKADANADGKITVDEIYDYVYAQVVKQTPKQTPGKWSYKEQGDIIIAQAPKRASKTQELSEIPEGKKEQEARFEEYYTKGLSAIWLEEWEEAVRYFEAIVEVRPDYEQADAKLQEARKQIRQSNLYNKAMAAMEAAEWEQGISILEVLVAEEPDYKDALEKLRFMRKQNILAELHSEAQHLAKAGEWQAVVNVFGQIHAIEPDFPDPDGLLSLAEREVAEQKRQAELDDLYSRAVREMDSGQWQAAHQLLTQVQEMEPGFRQAERLLARVEAEIESEKTRRQQQEQAAALYKQALDLANNNKQWQQILTIMADIRTLDPQFADQEGLADKAREHLEQRQRLESLYTQAQTAQEAGDWSGAFNALEELVAEAPDFKNAATLLKTAEKQKQLADLYEEAGQHHQAKQWLAVVKVFEQIHAIEPVYLDPDELLPSAQREVAKLERQAKLGNLYNRAVHEMDVQHWEEARQLLEQVQEMEPGYNQVERLITKAIAEIERQQAERQRQEQIATWYEHALGLARAGQWQQVMAKMAEVHKLNPEFDDPEGLAVLAQKEVTREEQEARRQSELAALYAAAVRLLNAGQYDQALEKWGEVRKRDPRYPDRKKVQKKAKRNLASPGERQIATWMWVLGGAIVILATLGVLLITNVIQLPGRQADVPEAAVELTTQTTLAAAVALEPTNTAHPLDPWGEIVIPPGDTLNVAFVGALSGDFSAIGEVEKNGFRMAVEEAAAVKGFQLDTPDVDSGCDQGGGKQSANVVISWENIAGVVGHTCSMSCRAAVPVYEEAHMVMISPSCTATDLTEFGYEIFNRIAVRDGEDYNDAQVVNTRSYQEFANRYHERFNEFIPEVIFEGTDYGFYAAHAYDAAGILIQSIEQVAEVDASGNLVIGRQTLARAVRATSGYQGVTGVISFDDNGDRSLDDLPPRLDLRVNYGADWVEGFYEAGHTVWITVTESDQETVKATAELVTEPKDFWGGETGFTSQAEDWEPGMPDIQPHDWVYGSMDNGASAQMQIGEIYGMINPEAGTIQGTINVPWFADEVSVECFPWGTSDPSLDTKNDSVLPDGEDTYFCSWEGEWKILSDQDVGVGYFGSDGHWVANQFYINAGIVAATNGDWIWTSGFSPYENQTISIYESKEPGAALLWEGIRTANINGFVSIDGSDHSLDFEPGNYLTVSDGIVKKGLVLELITTEIFDVNQDFMAGTAPPGREVRVGAGMKDGGADMTVTADPESGEWTADFKTLAFDITEEMRQWSFAQLLDEDGDANEALQPVR